MMPGDPKNPLKDIYFKIMPKGTTEIAGILLGYPTLDSAPYGLGWTMTEHSHHFASLGGSSSTS